MIYRAALLLFIIGFVFAAPLCAQDPGEGAAVAAAEDFLDLIDFGSYPESWEEGAYLLQVQVTKEEWNRKLFVAHEIFGRPLERSLRLATYRSTYGGVPDGDYFMVVFDTVYEKKKAAVETVIMAKETGEWRVAGFFLH